MPTVRLPWSVGNGGRSGMTVTIPPPDPSKARIVTEDGLALTFPFAPREVTHGGMADTFAQLDRPGRKPLTVRSGGGLRTVSFSVFIGYRDHQQSVEPILDKLRAIAASGDRLTLALSALEAGVKWNLTGLTIDTILRQQGTNAVTRATAALTFTEDVDAAVNVGPLSGGKKKGGKGGKGKGGDKGGGGKTGGTRPPRGDDRPNAPGSKGKSTTQRHTVAAGETLAAIALLYYGDPSDWRVIAEASGIRDPRKLKPGDRLVIPPEA